VSETKIPESLKSSGKINLTKCHNCGQVVSAIADECYSCGVRFKPSPDDSVVKPAAQQEVPKTQDKKAGAETEVPSSPPAPRAVHVTHQATAAPAPETGRAEPKTVPEPRIATSLDMCDMCNSMVKPGISVMDCPRCGKVYHERCVKKSKRCPMCGMPLGT
jgi:predicted  nucleic acid-binding Zn-ribbon protein